MAIQQATLESTFVHAIAGAAPDRRRLGRTTAIAVALSVAAHVAVGLYVYEAKYGGPPAPTLSDPPITIFTPRVPPPPLPPRTQHPPEHVLSPRASPAPPTAAQTTAPFTPVVAHPVDFAPPQLSPNIAIATPPDPPARPSVITSPDWLTRPGPNEFSRFYPQPALDRNASGMATLACTVAATGAVRDCQVAAETPKGLGFGEAARKLAPYFKLRPQLRDGAPVDGASIRIPIRFNLAA